ncbi:hypothetical protein FPV67DRAFT_1460934 [Lyophyllum atratum]|nr:hypothetical protein FPV67DRAFT_1460934 [Lyophyllum atratum]
MKLSSAFLIALPVALAAWSATATPTAAADRTIAALTARNLAARHAAEWDIFERDFEPQGLEARQRVRSPSPNPGPRIRGRDFEPESLEARQRSSSVPPPGGKHRRDFEPEGLEARQRVRSPSPNPGPRIRGRDFEPGSLEARQRSSSVPPPGSKHRRDFEPETLSARRSCKTSRDCLGMICINDVAGGCYHWLDDKECVAANYGLTMRLALLILH